MDHEYTQRLLNLSSNPRYADWNSLCGLIGSNLEKNITVLKEV